MLNFYPGPSKNYEQLPQFMMNAYHLGFTSINHRSKAFMKLAEETTILLQQKLNIPASYSIFFVSAATEVWEILAQSYQNLDSWHFFNGSFGEKWFQIRKHLFPHSYPFDFEINQELDLLETEWQKQGMFCFTSNETSNGTYLSNQKVSEIRQRFPQQLLAFDATSSLAGLDLPIKDGDIWFASVQKCFGLPAGLGLMFVSEKAIEVAKQARFSQHYNSILKQYENAQKFQTTHTPNILNIYLLKCVMEMVEPIQKIEAKTLEKYQMLKSFFEPEELLVQNPNTSSPTVITLKGNPKKIEKLLQDAENQNIILGRGYGKWRSNTFRIANFPAITLSEIEQLESFFKTWKKQNGFWLD